MIDALFVAPHPDDAEIFCGGTIALLVLRGYQVAIADMTEGEMGSQGSVAQRRIEVQKASEVLSISERHNLALPDGKLTSCLSGAENNGAIEKVVSLLRKTRPKVVFAPYWEARHPDHVATSRLISDACFMSALKNFAKDSGPSHQVNQVIYYQMRYAFRPSFITDVSEVYNQKLKAINCFASQVTREEGPDAPKTLVSSPLAIESIKARDAYCGSMIGIEFGEPFLTKNIPAIADPISHFVTSHDENTPAAMPLTFPGLLG